MKYLLIIVVLVSQIFVPRVFAQEKTEINKRDDKGKPIGFWHTFEPAEKGEPARSIFGYYDHGQKNGLWYESDQTGNLTSIEAFKQNVRDGEVKYFTNGQLTCVGHYRGLNPQLEIDTVHITDPITGLESWVNVPTERGSVRHGRWRFYDETSGRLLKEEQYQIDDLIYKKDFSISPADSIHYQKRNAMLPHNSNQLPPASKFKSKEPIKSLIGG
jgi:hypothetical protein